MNSNSVKEMELDEFILGKKFYRKLDITSLNSSGTSIWGR